MDPESPDTDALKRQIAELQAELAAKQRAGVTGMGSVAQGQVDAPGNDADKIDGDNAGPINTGTSVSTQGGAAVQGAVDCGGHFIGRDFIQYITRVVHAGEDAEEARSVIAHYLYALANDLAGLRLGEIDVAAKDTIKEPLQLADVYVPLDTHLKIPADMALEQWLSSSRGSEHRDIDRQQETRPVTALALPFTRK